MSQKASPNIKIDHDSGGNLRARLDKNQGLSRKERQELVDLLRRNLLYQTPRPLFAEPGDEHPTWVDVRLVFAHQQRILQLIHRAGGWTLPPEEKKKVLMAHEERARVAYADGVDYDFTGLSYGELVAMYQELEGVAELQQFRKAIGDQITELDKEPNT